TLGVKSSLSILVREALDRGADVALFGHTHSPFVEHRGGVVLLNPGSIGSGPRPSYGTLLVGDGKCYPSLWTLN
ncbi:MAG: metallophosphoesterase family protein, partial [Oscillospiraceae bacterium]|nr:metallophosphoesterase family protein [Oscillospiraceae bacterium]